MAGLLTPYAATELIGALRDTVKLPIHLHTHDTSSLQSATYLKAIEANVDVVDVALGGLSGLTSQPNFNSIVEMMKYHERAHEFDMNKLNQFSNYWEDIREYYYPFESGLKSGTAEVYQHEIPGGQYSNLRPQATALGLGGRFDEVKKMYTEVNAMFGNLVKVTPSSKVVGDMAIFMVSNNLTPQGVMENGEEISFPDSVIDFFKGDLGQPVGGFPKKLQKIILKNQKPFKNRPNSHLAPIDFDVALKIFKKKYQKGFSRAIEFEDFLSYLLYPRVFDQAHENYKKYGNLAILPTLNFFYGMERGEEITVELDRGKTLLITLDSIGMANIQGMVTVYFRVNGQGRTVQVKDLSINVETVSNRKVDKNNAGQIGSPLQGMLSTILVNEGDKVVKNQSLFIIEAMKMETTINAEDATIKKIILEEGSLVNSDDLVIELK